VQVGGAAGAVRQRTVQAGTGLVLRPHAETVFRVRRPSALQAYSFLAAMLPPALPAL